MENFKTSKEVAIELGISKRTVSRRTKILKLGHYGRKFRFDETDVALIKNYKRTNSSKKVAKTSTKIQLYYPLKTTETFYIYESKINNQ